MALTDLTGNSPPPNNNSSNSNGGNNNNNGNLGGISIIAGPPASSSTPPCGIAADIDELLINYNDICKSSGTILYRDSVISQTLSALIRKNKPNPLLIGQAGVGKTKIVEDIAYRLANNDPLIPDKLKGFTIYELPLSNVMSGSSLVGQLEEKVHAVVDFISNKKNKAILFIDELHQIIDGDEHYKKIAQILKPALARGNFHCIGSTTLQESTVLFSDPAFNRRFTRVIVDELTQTQTIEILKHSLPDYLVHYNSMFSIADSVLEAIVPIADQYINIGSHRPDNALTLLDSVVANEITKRKAKENELIAKQSDPDPNVAAAAQQALHALRSAPIVNITESKVRNTAIVMMKGNAKQENTDFDVLTQNLAHIKGQGDVIEKIMKVIKNHEKGLFPRKKPVTFMFTGTSGVGKTEITKIIAETVTGKKPILINMTEYSHSSSINNIVGSPIGYLGSDSKIELPFDCLESNPFQIILLDEFEKGHREVQRLFMRVFDEGILKTNRGATLDFSNTIIIATTNAANKGVKKHVGFGEKAPMSMTSSVEELKDWFDPELINRFEHIINFNTISADTYIEIIEDIYATESARITKLNRSYVLKPVIDPDDLQKMRDKYVPDFGARPAFRIVQEYIENQL